MAKSAINVLVNLDTRQFTRGLESTSKRIGRFASGSAVRFAKLGAGAAAGAAVAAAAFGKIAFSAAETASTSNARIGSIIDSMGLFGDAADATADRLINFANESAKLTGVNQNVIKEGQALLLTFKEIAGSADEAGGAFDRATQLTLDLAAAGFGSVTDNAKQLGKALNDPIKGLSALSRSGITFTDQQKAMIEAMVEAGDIAGAQNLILAEMEAQVGGTAEATANASDRIRVGFSQVTERIGLALMPAFERLTNFILDRVLPGIERLVDIFERDGLGGVFAELRRVFEREGPKALDKLRELAINAINWIATDYLPMMLGIYADVGKALWSWIEPQIKPTLKKLAKWAGDFANWVIDDGLPMLVDKLEEWGQALVDWIEPRIAPMLRQLGVLLGRLAEWVVTRALPRLLQLAGRMGVALIGWAFQLAPEILRGLGGMVTDLATWVKDEGIPRLATQGGKLLNSLMGWVSDLPRRIRSGLWSMLTAVTSWIRDNGWRLANKGADLIGDLIGGVADGIASAGGWITDLARRFVNAIIGFINTQFLEPFNDLLEFTIPIPFAPDININPPDIGPIPMLAKGGIVTGPTLALIGEAGPEAVVPLDRYNGGGGATYQITVNTGVGDAASIGQTVVEAISAYERRNGSGWRAA